MQFNIFITFFLKVNFDEADVPTHHEYKENVRIATCLTCFWKIIPNTVAVIARNLNDNNKP